MTNQHLLSKSLGLSPLLSEISPKDSRFNSWKSDNLLFSQMLQVALEARDFQPFRETLSRWYRASSNCGTFLRFRTSPQGLKLNAANFCRHRLCPLCSRRRLQMWQARIQEIIPALQLSEENCLFLTLTVKNFSVEDLDVKRRWLSESLNRLLQRLRDRHLLKGFIKSFEVTMPQNFNECHPHYHLVLAVDSKYFTSEFYADWLQWRSWWQESLQVDYLPSVHIRKIISTENALLEAIKYELKPGDYKKSWRWLTKLALNIKGSRRISTGGVFRQRLRFLEYDPDLIHEADREFFVSRGQKQKQFIFAWNSRYKQFLLQSKEVLSGSN